MNSMLPRLTAKSIMFGRIVPAACLLLIAGLASASLDYLDSALWTFPRDCAVRNGIACIAMPYGVQIWDVADPQNMEMISDVYFNGDQAYNIDWDGDLLAVTTELTGMLHLIDVSNVSAPVPILELSGLCTNADLLFQNRSGTRILYVGVWGGLKAYDLTDPEVPVELDFLSLAGNASSIMADGTTLAVLSKLYGLHTVDASDPSALNGLDSYHLIDPYLLNVAIDGDLAVTAHRQGGCRIFDVSNPSNISEIHAFLPNLGGPDLAVKDVILEGNLLYAVTDSKGVVTYDITNPTSPVLVGFDPATYLTTKESLLSGDRIYMTQLEGGTNSGLHVIDIADPAAPHSLGHTAAWDFTRFVDVDNGFAYTANGKQGATVCEYVPGSGFVLRGQIGLQHAWSVECAGGLVYLGAESVGLAVIDWTVPASPVVLGEYDPGALVRGITIRDDVAYLGLMGIGLATVDVEDPAAMALLDSTETGYLTVALALEGTVACTADLTAGCHFYDVSDPGDIQYLGEFLVSDQVNDVKLVGDIAYLAAGSSGLYVLDVSDPSLPAVLNNQFGDAANCWVEGDHLYVAYLNAGVCEYLITDPASPQLIWTYDTAGDPLTLTVEGDILYVADRAALLALNIASGTSVPEDPTDQAAANLRLSAFPNPFNPKTTLHFEAPQAGRIRVEVYDLGGRLLDVLRDGFFPGGAFEVAWDGRDSKGRELPSGVYLARLSSNAGSAAGKLILLR